MRKRKIIKQPENISDSTLTDWDRKFMAYHEAGHAVCSYYLPERELLVCVTIDPSNEAFGMIRTEPRQHHNETEISFRSMISTFLAGQIAEEMFLNSKTTSCIYDLSSARQIATDMVIKFGMGETYGVTSLNPNEYPYLTESMRESLCKDIQKILSDAENQARKILETHHAEVKEMADILLVNGCLHMDDIATFFCRERYK